MAARPQGTKPEGGDWTCNGRMADGPARRYRDKCGSTPVALPPRRCPAPRSANEPEVQGIHGIVGSAIAWALALDGQDAGEWCSFRRWLPETLLQIIVRTVSEQVYSAVRDRILSGEIPAGTAIRQDALAADLGVSKIPLREALTRLEQDALVSSQPNRGYVVRATSPAEAEEVFALRLKLEPDATAEGAARASVRDRHIATAAFELLEAESEVAGPRVALLNREFHLALIRPSQRLVTIQLIERLQLLSERYVRAHLEIQGRDRRARAEHDALLKAWLAGDATTVRRLVETHVGGTLADLRLELERKGAAALAPAPQRAGKAAARSKSGPRAGGVSSSKGSGDRKARE
jgi:DNA-binding GntR family transcriptional regulator